jgi:hypothetical protein
MTTMTQKTMMMMTTTTMRLASEAMGRLECVVGGGQMSTVTMMAMLMAVQGRARQERLLVGGRMTGLEGDAAAVLLG